MDVSTLSPFSQKNADTAISTQSLVWQQACSDENLVFTIVIAG